MEKNFILNRRTVLGGAAALGTAGVLAACGSSKDSKATTKGATVGTDAKELYDLGEAAVSELKDGGTLRLAVPGIGPDFNLFSADGNSLYTQTAMSPVAYAGLWQGDPMGKRTLAPDFAKSFDVSEENGLPVVSIELNPRLSSTTVPPSTTRLCRLPGTSSRAPMVTTRSEAAASTAALLPWSATVMTSR